MHLYQSEEYVLDLPGIGFVSYTNSGLINVNLEDIKGRNKILVTYRDPSKINKELKEEKMKNLEISKKLDIHLSGLAGVGCGFGILRNRLGFAGIIPYFLNKFLSKLYERKIKKINVWNHFKQFFIEPDFRHIYTLFFSESDRKKGVLNVSKFARKAEMNLIAGLYEKQYLQ